MVIINYYGRRALGLPATRKLRLAQEKTGFRAFSYEDFRSTSSWDRLQKILAGNGGCYGLYGPRGSGKSWLMLKAIDYAYKEDGMGLWFPSPSEYDASAFLSSLSDNLASSIERLFVRNNTLYNLAVGLRKFLTAIGAVLVAIGIIIYLVRSFSSQTSNGSTHSSGSGITSLLPSWLWITAASVLALLLALFAVQLIHDTYPSGRLVREATALRERIRFTASLKSGAELGLGGNAKSFTASLKRSNEKALSERPTTIASLVFDFRNLVEALAAVMNGPIVIGIDELDKLPTPTAARALLRDIKGIFEVTGVHFLVSVSEEASAALQLGTLQSGGRNEFNSSFYTIIELPPLELGGAERLLMARDYSVSDSQAYALCLVSAGNQRELVRIADATLGHAPALSDSEIISQTMRTESWALLFEIIRSSSVPGSRSLTSEAKSGAWKALSSTYFESVDSFVSLGREAIVNYWDAPWREKGWESVSEPWRRLLVRLFVSANWLELCGSRGHMSDDAMRRSIFADMLDIMNMAGQDAGVARLVLKARFGENLNGEYQSPAVDTTAAAPSEYRPS
jgi:hypothetical protein